EAYDLVQNLSLRCWQTGESLKDLSLKNITVLSEEEIENIFDSQYYIKHVDEIYKRFKGE
ncbi:MAG TPA: adenylosuccinate lyase, partial [Pseudothermotoga sp.]|nr:adenylosuccinate lyase [Pseudothermotoga sp.]